MGFVKILYDSILSCLCCLFDLGIEYLFPIAVETRCSHRIYQLDGDVWQHWFIVSLQLASNSVLLLTPSQVLLAIQLGTFIREFISHLYPDKHRVYCDVLGI